ncbi:MAG: BrnT family toxin [Gammaproteobacteria bacterium]|nr:BrnT family toxin [Gammaproteobacteria bacterium]
MHFEWDKAKAASNAKKHGVRFPEAVVALQDGAAFTIEDPDSEGEDRFVSIGADDLGRLLVTVFTYRNEGIRIISSRRATNGERRLYEDAQ